MNVYEIFTKLTMVNGASGVIAAVAKEALSLEAGIGRINKAFSSLNATSLAIGGGLGILGGAGTLALVNKMVEHGEKLVHVKQQLLAADVKGVELAQATAKAW